ncbi:ATP-binding protein [Lentzea sp. NPDC042327]|uniref:DEAD/DEAH box helicase n=1 Tax=Lentzea sp. NPDC042327 TaxID=3154801 RepID=UPI00340C817F
MSGADVSRAEIINYWHTIEMFSPPDVPAVREEHRVYQVAPGQPLPWEPTHRLQKVQLEEHLTWRYRVYCGVFSLEDMNTVLERVFPPDQDSYDERPAGHSALTAFVLDVEGRPLFDSNILSTCAWATGRAVDPGPRRRDWLDGFDEDEAEADELFRKLVAAAKDDPRVRALAEQGISVGRPLAAADLTGYQKTLCAKLGLPGDFDCSEIRIKCELVSHTNAYREDDQDFLNSFIAADLRQVSADVRAGSCGTALRQYLSGDREIDTAARIDVREELGQVLDVVRPDAVPLGRWPSNVEHPLALSQQLAVNNVLSRLSASAGIFGVNGPPGTGKTTMLRDLIAAIVVERACRLAELSRPAAAFRGKRQWKVGDYTRTVHLWREDLTGFEIVVASKNNGAVENVTNEIPAVGAIDDAWRDEVDYFPEIATALLNVDQLDADRKTWKQAWGMVAARLGNKTNRGKFATAFWYGIKPKPKKKQQKDVAEPPPIPGMNDLLKAVIAEGPDQSWTDAVRDFRSALAAAQQIQADRGAVDGTFLRLKEARDRGQTGRGAFERAGRQLEQVNAALSEARQNISAWQAEQHKRSSARQQHLSHRPNLVQSLFGWGRPMRNWQQVDDGLAAQFAEAFAMNAQWGHRLQQLERDTIAAQHELDHHGRVVREADQEVGRLEASLRAAETSLGDFFPGDTWWTDDERRELKAPWTDSTWNDARTRLFFAALRLHKAFLQNAAHEMRQSLQAAMDVVQGAAPRDLPEATIRAAWQTLFFLVPVVSTTFASVSRVFPRLGPESLGWLFIDEAGQATPQDAVGAIWRSRRVVVVGDPLQLEPIVSLPFRVQQAIRGDHGVDEKWLPARTSAQQLADQLTPLGTHLPTDDGPIWVGSPLRVHRRCDEPMFGIVNQIAYDGMMIKGGRRSKDLMLPSGDQPLPESKWLHISSEESSGHWKPAESKKLGDMLAYLAKSGFDMSEVMVIGPFRDVAREIGKHRRQYPGLVAGTVHTAQGKEADIVILVLGGDPRRPGAKKWAASKPNLVNVAVSRAKRRLYVIGDRTEWSKQRHFDVLAQGLPCRE